MTPHFLFGYDEGIMPPANPEQGLMGLLKKIFLGRREQPVLPAPAQLSAAERDARRAERERRAKARPPEIIEELKHITSSHPARQLLPSIDFSTEVLTQYPQLTEALLNVISVRDLSNYHDPAWLMRHLEEIHNIETSLAANPRFSDDRQRLQEIEIAFEKSIRSAMQFTASEEAIGQVREDARDTRLVDMERQIRQAKGEAVQEDLLPAVARQATPARTLTEAVDRVKASPNLSTEQRAELERLMTQIGPEDNLNLDKKLDHDRVEEGGNAADLAAKLEELMKQTIGSVKGRQLDRATLEDVNNQYIQQREAFEKLGRRYIEKYQKGGRLSDEIRTRGGYELMEKALHEDPNLRDYWFYHILSPILYNERADSSRELYNLYVAGDMDLFLDIVRKTKDARGNPIGLKIANKYTILKNTLFQSHDMDYYAAHPQQDMKEFIGSTAMFLNTYVDAAHQDPMVSLAKRMYETALFTIRESHGGYIPREYLSWHTGRHAILLDEYVDRLVRQSIASGQLCQVKMDPVTGFYDLSPSDRLQIDPEKKVTLDDLYGGEAQLSENWRRQLGELKISAALKQAKGLALVDMRLLEIISRSKGTGSDHFRFGGSGFNSVPYEGIVRHIEPIVHYFTRWYIGREDYPPFFNMMITNEPGWNAEKMKRLIELSQDGDHETLKKEFGEAIDTRLNSMDNPFAFSGMWGTFTKWRMNDSTVGWDDWDRERFATANKLCLVGDSFFRKENTFQTGEGTIAYRKVKQYFTEVVNPDYQIYMDEYRQHLLTSEDVKQRQTAADDALFEVYWRKVGLGQTGPGRAKSYKALLDEHWNDKYIVKTHEGSSEPKEKVQEWIKKMERAYKARIWVQAAMRAPLIVAREVDIPGQEWEKAEHAQTRRLRAKILYEVLGIDLKELVPFGTPPKVDKQKLAQIMDLEGAVAAVSQAAIRENRDLRDEDFDRYGENTNDTLLASQAKQYWMMVKDAMLGNLSASQWYQSIGIEDANAGEFGVGDVLDLRANGARFHRIDWHKIHGVSVDEKEKGDKNKLCIQELGPTAINNKLLDRDWRHLFSTEDMGWEYLNMGELGERNQVRRAGDLASHAQFNTGLEELLNVVMTPRFKADDYIEHLKKMWVAMAGDDANMSIDACGRIIYTLGQMYRKSDWAWRIPGAGQAVAMLKSASIMQKLHGGPAHADAVGPNQLREFIDKAVDAKLIPHNAVNPLTGRRETWSEWNADVMYKRLGAVKANALYELITLGVLISLALTVYRAFTAKSEEEEAGGGRP